MHQYGDIFPRGQPNHSVSLFFLLEDAIDWIKSRVLDSPHPFLGYFHLLPPHEPYCTRREFVDYFNDGWKPLPKPILRFSQNQSQAYLDRQRRFYDEYIAYADAEFGRLYDALESSGALDDTILILTSDHGQMFERGIHGHLSSTLYDPLIHILLLISLPGQTQRHNIGIPTSCVDVLPTLLHLAGKPVPDWCEGQVLPGLSDSASETERSIFTVEAKSNPKNGPLKTGTVMMVKGRYKIIHYFGNKGHRDIGEIYDLVNDPSEREDRQGQDAISVASDLKGELVEKLEQANQLLMDNP
jgi:arylsulfatase A-like enzyme